MPYRIKQELIEQINRCLPQTQCTQCSYPRCLKYAEAIANNEADINQCPPGGEVTIRALSELLQVPMKSLNLNYGTTKSKEVAFIDESRCIGCKLCIKACPVDSIIGSVKLMHTVIVHECTGCKLCVPVCPTDCINLVPIARPISGTPSLWDDFSQEQVDHAYAAVEQKIQRAALTKSKIQYDHRKQDRSRMQEEIFACVLRETKKRDDTKTNFHRIYTFKKSESKTNH